MDQQNYIQWIRSRVGHEKIILSHKHAHTHLITHTHDGSTHTHAIEHSHDHAHVINEGKHGHTHSVEELEIALGHRGGL